MQVWNSKSLKQKLKYVYFDEPMPNDEIIEISFVTAGEEGALTVTPFLAFDGGPIDMERAELKLHQATMAVGVNCSLQLVA